MQKIKKIHWEDPVESVSQTETDRQTDGQMNRTDFIGPLPQKWRFHVFEKLRIKFS